jgi:hypothetical protein
MHNSPLVRPRRIYAPRSTVMTKRLQIGIDPTLLARCKAADHAENKTDAAYVLEVYLEGLAQRHHKRGAVGAREAK